MSLKPLYDSNYHTGGEALFALCSLHRNQVGELCASVSIDIQAPIAAKGYKNVRVQYRFDDKMTLSLQEAKGLFRLFEPILEALGKLSTLISENTVSQTGTTTLLSIESSFNTRIEDTGQGNNSISGVSLSDEQESMMKGGVA